MVEFGIEGAARKPEPIDLIKSLVHNCFAHPLLFIGDLGTWLHDITAPED